jgi:hypothetical protein
VAPSLSRRPSNCDVVASIPFGSSCRAIGLRIPELLSSSSPEAVHATTTHVTRGHGRGYAGEAALLCHRRLAKPRPEMLPGGCHPVSAGAVHHWLQSLAKHHPAGNRCKPREGCESEFWGLGPLM